MAEDVGLQRDVTVTGEVSPRTLHLKLLRKQWQIISLQVIATVALVGMYLEVVSNYVVGSIDHTMLFDTIELLIGDQLPIGDWLTGEGRSGLARFFVPLVLGLLVGGGMALLAFQTPKIQQRVKLGFIVTLIVVLIGQLMLSWLTGMLFSFDLRLPNSSELSTLEWPLLMILSMMILFLYLLPVIMGVRGIWGLSRRSIAWAIGFTLLFLGIHAILAFPLINGQLGTYGDSVNVIGAQFSDPTIGIFGLMLVNEQQFALILIAVLIMVFQESSYGVIRYLEYAYRLPESCKRDPEYVRQMDNVLNTHLKHTFGFLGLTGVATMIALGFHTVLLGFVEDSTGSQWAGQISESIELSLTYGLVISAAMFLSIMALLRFFVPWERIWGLIYSRRNADATPAGKEVVEI
ncbi:MAG: hypothetical protein L7U62_02145 [Candidatus Poseidoniaceae archaeon]|nr:hypothetical protein [Candidatus Poseidoniaceae archaeon]